MRNYFIIALVLIAAGFVSCDDGWKVSGTSEFSIEFPGPAKDTATMSGNLAGARTYYEPAEGSLDSNLYYAVSMYTLPDSVSILGAERDEFFQKDVQIYAWSIGGVLADNGRPVKSGEYEGREYKVTLEGNSGIATVRKFAYGRHLYTLLVVTNNMCLNNHAIRRFMDSFKLKGGQEIPKTGK